MSSFKLDEGTFQVEVTNITVIGMWLLTGGREYFIPFEHYPGLRQATVEQIVHVEQPAPDQFYWPDLDIDIEAGALNEPERFPLQFRP